MYPLPKEIGAESLVTPDLVISYTLNGIPAIKTIPMKDSKANSFDINRNTIYTLQIGNPDANGNLTFNFAISAWTMHEFDADLNGGETVLP